MSKDPSDNRRLPLTGVSALGLLLILACQAAGADSGSGSGESGAVNQARGFFYGGAISAHSEIYRDYDRRVVLIPVIGYRGERLRVFGPFVSYDLYRAGALSLDARLAPRFQGFDDSDGDNFRGMDDREDSLDIGLGLKYARAGWSFELTGLRDALDRSNGSEWSAGVGRAFRAGRFRVEPALGVEYLDAEYVDYYYGVETAEATNFRPAYVGDSALNTRLGVTFATPAFLGGLTRIRISRTWFDSSIEDSPLTEDDADLSIFVAFTKFFDH